ncbi:MAG: plasmid mobilization relaxosome protein MobC [Niabella sp.]
MNEQKSNRTRIVQARLTPDEYQHIHSRLSRSTFKKMSDFLRYAVLDKPIKMLYRNQSLDDFMSEMILLRKELNAIGNNYNQAVKKLHIYSEVPEVKIWLLMNENTHQVLLQKISEIKSKINQINDQWLQ